VQRRSRRLGIVVVAIAAVLFAGACGSGDDSNGLTMNVASPATAPFAMFGETRLALGSDCLRLLVAESKDQRVQGLRDVTSLAPYDGMLFVYDGDTDASFTMANTPLELDMTWLDADGQPVDHTVMTPCTDGTDATCPLYASKGKYRYALERPAPASGGGALGPCA
jgi:uncharacterized membrane protein (UPF0127 family)